ncbi:hypothetical protein [Acidiluteibacter ferrifornacis]|uniref:Lipoprotein n=1 Tax=Acidiluteibacter ferrifornacis TaxID=2692424 RepID=A0A6N9NHN2_9FLAO|nr:hypothetical protein [Acidiluteibacter ferrifornacis]NBG64707.1 hypothetical protein [Acidiluteibacter ferrifornacis]|tara:strand:+ start:492 stop:764 length:273 start_codon:yes stop_codon:yes gene_type:complete
MRLTSIFFKAFFIVAFSAIISACNSDSNQTAAYKGYSLNHVDSSNATRSKMVIYKDAGSLVDSKIKETNKRNQKISISLPDIITYFMSSF